MHIRGDIYVQHIEMIFLAQIICQINETSRSGFGNAIVDNH